MCPSTTESVRVAVNSCTAPHADLPSFLASAKLAGFEAVELSGNLISRAGDDALAVTRDFGLDVVGLSPTTTLFDWHWSWDATTERVLATELTRAQALGVSYFVLPFMRDRGDENTVSRHLEFAEHIAADTGVKLAVEAIGHHTVLRRTRDLVKVVAERDPSIVGVLLDSFHFFRAGNTLDDLKYYRDVSVLALQLSNANTVPVEELLGYRDRTFPLDGPFAVEAMTGWWINEYPGLPLIVEVIGDLVKSIPTEESLTRASDHMRRLLAAPLSNPLVNSIQEP